MKINYDLKMEESLKKIVEQNAKPRLLIHIVVDHVVHLFRISK